MLRIRTIPVNGRTDNRSRQWTSTYINEQTKSQIKKQQTYRQLLIQVEVLSSLYRPCKLYECRVKWLWRSVAFKDDLVRAYCLTGHGHSAPALSDSLIFVDCPKLIHYPKIPHYPNIVHSAFEVRRYIYLMCGQHNATIIRRSPFWTVCVLIPYIQCVNVVNTLSSSTCSLKYIDILHYDCVFLASCYWPYEKSIHRPCYQIDIFFFHVEIYIYHLYTIRFCFIYFRYKENP